MTNIILCGGSGTRLWPLSRTLMPKQFVKLFDEKSLFQLTVNRNQMLCTQTIIVSNTEQYFLALDQIEELNYNDSKVQYLLEPIGRNTAPAIALACMLLDKEELVFVTPSDHLIKNKKAYNTVVQRAKQLAEENYLVTFGITPTSAETGFGYIEANSEDVTAFHEKPNIEKAEEYLDAGNYYWNSGIFCFKAGVFLEELQKYSHKIYEQCTLALTELKQENIVRISYELMNQIPEDSIDYAVMEQSSRVKVVPSSIEWSDLGSFESLDSEIESTSNLININSSNNLILSEKKVALVDINNLIVVDTPDALFISEKGSSSKVKQIVTKLNEEGSELTKNHTLTHRPWGTYEVLLSTNQYKIKRIIVQPNKRLSLQKHYHRNEHWIVVSGTATVTVGDETKLIRPNESTYIKMGEIHRLSNDGKIPVVLIEAQVGEYTGEDDIVRIEDDYERGNN
jgi:mannose-1-phosphate guanylyltransferase